jgi:hypothetical protein
MKRALLLLTLAQFAFAGESFLPKNDFFIPADALNASGMKEEQFNAVIDKVEKIYSPIVAAQGAELKIERLWKNGAVNAEAEQFGNQWVVRMFGGMARWRDITEDSFTIVLCHEIGHHIGGAPIYRGQKTWASNEGQADYFAVLKCLRRVWDEDDNQKIVAGLKYRPVVAEICKKSPDQAQCIRAAVAGIHISDMLSFMGRTPAAWIERPVLTGVEETYDLHNSPQCRLDTFTQAALCEKKFTEDLSRESAITGACHEATGEVIGMRPRCWFKP